jgi:hypothetical protein
MSLIESLQAERVKHHHLPVNTAERITWFLALQDIQGVQRFPMAPRLLRFLPRKSLATDNETLSEVTGSGSHKLLNPRSLLRIPQHLQFESIAKPASISIDSGAKVARRGLMSLLPQRMNCAVSRQPAASVQRTSSATGLSLPAFAQRLSRHVISSGSLAGVRSRWTNPVYPSVSATVVPGLDRQVWRSGENILNSEPWRPNPAPVGKDGPWPRGTLTSRDGPAENRNEAFSDNYTRPPNGDKLGLESQSSSRPGSGSTLHLDGAALGRWTIDHLGHVLGKPSTGMTGVDPRASIPRSRISPF